MNRYALWKYIVIAVVLVVSALFTLPNFFGEAPAVQVSSGKATIKLDALARDKVDEALKAANLSPDLVTFDGTTIKARFQDTDSQLKAKDAIQKALIPDPSDPAYVVALNLVSRSPKWLSALHAFPMYLGLDLRGGVHFMLQVDMQAALTKKVDSLSGDVRSALREKQIRGRTSREGQTIEVRFSDAAALEAAKRLVQEQFTDLQTKDAIDGTDYKLTALSNPRPPAACKTRRLSKT
jgi:preprotein translocase subunit SecD